MSNFTNDLFIFSLFLIFWASPNPVGVTLLVLVVLLVVGTFLTKWITAYQSEGEARRERVLIAGGFSFGGGPGFKIPSRPILNPSGMSKGN